MAFPPKPMVTPPRSFESSASRASSAFSARRERRIFIAVSLLAVWLRSFWTETTMPLGRCVRRTALSVLFTCWPPAPEERKVSTRISSSSSSIAPVSSRSGATITWAKLVWRRGDWSNGLRRTRRGGRGGGGGGHGEGGGGRGGGASPPPALRMPYAFSPAIVNVADLMPYS